MVLDPTDLDTRFVNEADHDKTAHDALALSHDSLSDIAITGAQIEASLMFGSANAAYVPLTFYGPNNYSFVRVSAGFINNLGADDLGFSLILTQPTNKYGLKLWISNLKFGVKDADAQDFITTVRIHGMNEADAFAELDIDSTNHTSIGDKTFSGAVMPASAIDCSGYQSIIVSVSCTNFAAYELDVGNFRMECYYAA